MGVVGFSLGGGVGGYSQVLVKSQSRVKAGQKS